jgi:DNA repair protein RadA/Sms
VLSGGKNRFGSEGEVAWFEMGRDGLSETEAGPPIGDGSEPGCAATVALAGRRALAVEVQALVVGAGGPPRRYVDGLSPRRFEIVAAVTDRSARFDLMRSELYGSVAGGYRLEDPGADLAVSVALASSATGRPAGPAMAYVGEVSLTGAVRAVGGMEQRAAAAAAAGVRTLVCAASERDLGPWKGGVTAMGIRHVRDALTTLVGSGNSHSPARRDARYGR